MLTISVPYCSFWGPSTNVIQASPTEIYISAVCPHEFPCLRDLFPEIKIDGNHETTLQTTLRNIHISHFTLSLSLNYE